MWFGRAFAGLGLRRVEQRFVSVAGLVEALDLRLADHPAEVRPAYIRLIELGACEVGAGEVGLYEIAVAEIDPAEAGTAQVGADNVARMTPMDWFPGSAPMFAPLKLARTSFAFFRYPMIRARAGLAPLRSPARRSWRTGSRPRDSPAAGSLAGAPCHRD